MAHAKSHTHRVNKIYDSSQSKTQQLLQRVNREEDSEGTSLISGRELEAVWDELDDMESTLEKKDSPRPPSLFGAEGFDVWTHTAPDTPLNTPARPDTPTSPQEELPEGARATSSEGYENVTHFCCPGSGSSVTGSDISDQEQDMDVRTQSSDETAENSQASDMSQEFAMDDSESRTATPSNRASDSSRTLSDDDTMSTFDSDDDEGDTDFLEEGDSEISASPDAEAEDKLHFWWDETEGVGWNSDTDEDNKENDVPRGIATAAPQSTHHVDECGAASSHQDDALPCLLPTGDSDDLGCTGYGSDKNANLQDSVGDCVITSMSVTDMLPFSADLPGLSPFDFIDTDTVALPVGLDCGMQWDEGGPEPLHTASGSEPLPVPVPATVDGTMKGRVELCKEIVCAVESTKQQILGGVQCPAEIQVAVDAELLGLVEKICGLLRRY